MTCLIALTNDELLQRMAAYNNSPENLSEAKHEVLRRISKKSVLTSHDVALVEWLVEKTQEIENDDFDLIESPRVQELGRQYVKLKRQVLARMEGQDQFCQCGAL